MRATRDRETLAKAGVAPELIFPRHNLYQESRRGRGQVLRLRPSRLRRLILQQGRHRGAEPLAYRTWPEALTNLTLRFEQETARCYYFMYFGEIDGHGHTYGPESRQLAAEADCLLMLLARFLGRMPTAVAAHADPFHRRSWPGRDRSADDDLSQPAHSPASSGYLKTDRQGRPLLLGGSPCDLFLYVREECVDEVHALLARELAGKAEVRRTAELIRDGMFGKPASADDLLIRTGNLMVLPHRYESVFLYEQARFEQKNYGNHGGLTPQEMLVPFVAMAT